MSPKTLDARPSMKPRSTPRRTRLKMASVSASPSARVVQHAVGAPDLVLDAIFFVEQQSLSRAAFLVYNFTDRDAQIVAKLALRQPQ